jgi:predicted hydrocarbon binding protein
MFKLVTQLMLAKKLQFNEGEISLLNTKICLIPPDIYLFLLKELREEGEDNIIYELSFESSKEWFQDIEKSNGKSSPERFVLMIPKILNLLALGKLSMINFNLEKKVANLKLENSLTAELWGESEVPVDIQFAGLLGGAFSLIFGDSVKCVEEKCLSQGGNECIFKIFMGE